MIQLLRRFFDRSSVGLIDQLHAAYVETPDKRSGLGLHCLMLRPLTDRESR